MPTAPNTSPVHCPSASNATLSSQPKRGQWCINIITVIYLSNKYPDFKQQPCSANKQLIKQVLQMLLITTSSRETSFCSVSGLRLDYMFPNTPIYQSPWVCPLLFFVLKNAWTPWDLVLTMKPLNRFKLQSSVMNNVSIWAKPNSAFYQKLQGSESEFH